MVDCIFANIVSVVEYECTIYFVLPLNGSKTFEVSVSKCNQQYFKVYKFFEAQLKLFDDI